MLLNCNPASSRAEEVFRTQLKPTAQLLNADEPVKDPNSVGFAQSQSVELGFESVSRQLKMFPSRASTYSSSLWCGIYRKHSIESSPDPNLNPNPNNNSNYKPNPDPNPNLTIILNLTLIQGIILTPTIILTLTHCRLTSF